MYHQCRSRGYATVVDVLMDIGVLQKDKYEDWRFGRIPYLERVCMVNLGKLSTVRHIFRMISSFRTFEIPMMLTPLEWVRALQSVSHNRQQYYRRGSSSPLLPSSLSYIDSSG